MRQKSSKDGAEARRHCHPVHSGVRCCSLSEACTTEECIKLSAHEIVVGRSFGSVKRIKTLQVCGKKQLRVWTQHEDDEPQNDPEQAVFDSGAQHPRLGAMSVHKGHRMFHHMERHGMR